ncbi:glycosyltransferase family 2 protein [Corynebacterium sp. 153RC1]|uniref:glycosyltransferase family 2 protein n=1 Tax=unclassified Corynebacterium TaxID=2624378 RepID=UPI00211CCFF6|nr:MULTISPECIES: glycosyltransferase family 2 protein [unclassified Corynebacterium]MCQ9370024.1 glycosyltransferase family 2 protein [Corynebacterium sp. 35RC1]MCQ9352134.1 glycosyltransferase family 2 protein [Corynebacterium sp. 209RC1]MCQ9354136.1 glycosyltransferase family 2 protein [Corynebacterium sp. 1222RC1]MCQ9356416.1 glycosyltransferase family 2 protein [Corynebacterium sp. 122RC1]MCQ9358518.1 glycosyltransferase family 2 protein [Corynebacterium sp. 142RC1]
MANVNKPLAVITVTYSPGEHLDTFLSSLRTATSAGTVVILADNGSTDGVPEQAAKDHEHVEFFPTGGNVGYGTAINRAVRHLQARREAGEIRGDYFLFANPDVEFGKGSIDALITALNDAEQAACAGPYIAQEDGSPYPSARAVPTLRNGIGHALFGQVWPSNPWTKAYKDDADMTQQRPAGWLSGSCLLVRWDAFEQVGGFDERYFMYMEDVDLGDRFGRADWQNLFCPQAVISHEVGHAAGKVPERMLPAHHASAYRFLADRHPAAWQAPLRVALKVGLGLRARVAVAAARRKK